jgi:hypothetical protein
MTIQLSVATRNAILDAIETTAGASAKLRLYSGSKPADCATAASGSLLAEIALPSDWMSAASGGTKSLAGTWQTTGQAAAGSGTNAGYYRIVDNAGTTCHEQGTVTVTGGGGDLTLDNVNIAQNQQVTITSKVLTAPNA